MSNDLYCDDRCDEMGCRGHDVRDFKGHLECAADPLEVARVLFELLEQREEELATIVASWYGLNETPPALLSAEEYAARGLRLKNAIEKVRLP